MGDRDLLVVDVVEEHVDPGQVVGRQIDLLTEEPLTHIVLAQNLRELQQQRGGAGGRVAQPVTMDTRTQCGAMPSDSVDTGYELGIRTDAVIWRLAC